MISRAERLYLPTFRELVQDLGDPCPGRIARALGVHQGTVERWRRHDRAPRAARLALYWFTSWGQSELSTDLHNRAMSYTAHIEAEKRENAALRRELARVLAAGDFGSANAPSWRETPAELLARRRG